MFNSFFDKSGKPATKPPSFPTPSGRVESDEGKTEATRDLVDLAIDGWTIKQEIERLQKELKEITEKLETVLDAGTVLHVDGVCRITLSERTTFKLIEPDKCAGILGGRFADLVDVSTEYTPTDKLKEMVFDPDHPLAENLRGCFAIKSSAVVTFRPGKPL